MVGRQAGHAQIYQLAPDLGLDASVLRDAMLRDDHVRLDFQARNDGGLQAFRRRLHFLHHTVNAITQAESLFQRLQVDVRRAQLERVHDELVHQPDERRIAIHIRAVVGWLGDVIHLVHRQFLDHVLERAIRN